MGPLEPQVGWHRFEDEIIPRPKPIAKHVSTRTGVRKSNVRSWGRRGVGGREGWMDAARNFLLPKFSRRRGGW